MPLAVRTPEDLALKALVERQYLVFNLLHSGKVAWDSGDFATAVKKWDTLLRLPELDSELEKNVRNLLAQARNRAGQPPQSGPTAAPLTALPRPSPTIAVPTPSVDETGQQQPLRVAVQGSVSGGGAAGPGGAVVTLRRVDGRTPRPAAVKPRVISQKNKTFDPRIVVVPVGSSVDFRNDDPLFHNVFSLSRPNEFDAGLYKGGSSYSKVFNRPGPVEILCNIHDTMIAYVYVVDTPYYALARANGSFRIRAVPPGQYELEVWHEGSTSNPKRRITVGQSGVAGLSVPLSGERRQSQISYDKYGRPRQKHLGY